MSSIQRHWRGLALAGLILAGNMGHAAAQNAAQNAGLTPIRAAYIPVITWLPAWIAKDKGFFAQHGLDVSLAATQNLSVLPGTLGRQFDIAPSTPPDLIKAAASGIDVVAVAGECIETKETQSTAVIVRKDSGITSIKDLKGKVIASPTLGAVVHVSVLHWLKQSGVDPASIRGVEVPFPNMGDQLKAGRVDAVEEIEPFVGQLIAAGNVSLGDPLLSVGDEVLFPFWIAQGAWAQSHTAEIKAWRAALTDAKAFLDKDPAGARSILAKYTNLPDAVAQRIPFPAYRFTIAAPEMDIWVKVLEGLGQIGKPIDANKLVLAVQ
jgi:NitT/TauT family transport system substrate-binding protein